MYGNGFRAIIAVALGLVVTPGHGFSPNPWYYDYWCDNEGDASLKYLDDSKCAKVFPSSFSREWQCSVAAENNDVPSDVRSGGGRGVGIVIENAAGYSGSGPLCDPP